MLFWPESFLIICLYTLSGLKGVEVENLWWYRKHELSKLQAQQSRNCLSAYFCCSRHFPTYETFSETNRTFFSFCLEVFLGAPKAIVDKYFCGQIHFSSIAKKSTCHFLKNSSKLTCISISVEISQCLHSNSSTQIRVNN